MALVHKSSSSCSSLSINSVLPTLDLSSDGTSKATLFLRRFPFGLANATPIKAAIMAVTINVLVVDCLIVNTNILKQCIIFFFIDSLQNCAHLKC